MPKYINVDDYKELIEREKAEVNLIGYKFEDGCKIGLGIAIEVIDEMPSADVVEVKHGEWVDDYCSECGCDIPAYIEDWHWKKDMNAKYCPNCGAYMRERKEIE